MTRYVDTFQRHSKIMEMADILMLRRWAWYKSSEWLRNSGNMLEKEQIMTATTPNLKCSVLSLLHLSAFLSLFLFLFRFLSLLCGDTSFFHLNFYAFAPFLSTSPIRPTFSLRVIVCCGGRHALRFTLFTQAYLWKCECYLSAFIHPEDGFIEAWNAFAHIQLRRTLNASTNSR